jgi:hypothetical protein
MKLGEIAHARAGDKGDVSQISVIAYDPADFPRLCREVTVARVRAHLAALPLREAVRYELPALGALNFVLNGALGGGVTRSLSLDAHGKTLSTQLLDLELDAAQTSSPAQ